MRIYPGFILSLRASRIIYPGSAEAQDNISLAIYPDNFFQDILLGRSAQELKSTVSVLSTMGTGVVWIEWNLGLREI